ncbi:MAG: hypothetical protein ACPIOQ_56805, partial [Promethearchaeia archaeon]
MLHIKNTASLLANWEDTGFLSVFKGSLRGGGISRVFFRTLVSAGCLQLRALQSNLELVCVLL